MATNVFANATSVTGGVFVVGANALAAAASVTLNAAAAQSRALAIQTGGVDRWRLRGSSAAESGSDAGTAFEVEAYTDAGASIDKPVSIVRAAGGTCTITRPLSVTSTFGISGLTTCNAGCNISDAINGNPAKGVGVYDSTAFAAGVGGMVTLYGKYSGSSTYGAAIAASKVNGTTGDYGFNMLLKTRLNGAGSLATALTLGADLAATFAGKVTYASKVDTAATGTIDTAGYNVIYLNPASPYNLTTLSNGADGQRVTLINKSANAVTIKDGTGNIQCTADITLGAKGCRTFVYSSTSSEWLADGKDAN